MFLYNTAVDKARSVKQGDMVSWNASGGRASGKVVRVVSSGTLSVPDSKFQLKGDKDNPAVLIQLYRDGKPTEKKVGHKLSSLTKSIDVIKHGSHDQKTHGRGGKGGGGGGGGSPASSGSSSEKDKQGDQLADDFLDKTDGMSNLIDDAIDPNRQNAKEVKALGRAAEKIEAARDDFSAAKKLTGSKKVSKLQSGVKKYESSMEELITAGEDNILQELGSALNEGIANTLGLQFYMGDN
jgi:hypothetical protein